MVNESMVSETNSKPVAKTGGGFVNGTFDLRIIFSFN